MPDLLQPHIPTPAELELERSEMLGRFVDQVDAIDAARAAADDSTDDSGPGQPVDLST